MEFTTRAVDRPDRLAAWRDVVNREFLPLAITPIGDATFDAAVTGRGFGGLRVWHVEASPMRAVRENRHIRVSAHDDYLIGLHLRGTAEAAQDGRDATLRPGDFALFDSRRPYSISFLGPFEHVIYQVPRARLEARLATAIAVSATSDAGRLVSPYLRTLAGLATSRAPDQALVDAGLDLAVRALRSASGAGTRCPASDLRAYALAHLADPDLSPQAVANARYISVRQLHRLFACEGLTFGAWIREQRLRLSYSELTDDRLSYLSVAEIAARYGFRSASHFSRVFHARYGITPGSARRPDR